jgi:tetratricopeptide (TPR) repeat protein
MSEQVVEKDLMLQLQSFWNKFQKQILGGLIAILVVVGGWYAYKQFMVKPKEEKAADLMFGAEKFYRADSLNKALNGDGVTKGFLYIIKNYGGTTQGNLANYYAGTAYLRLKDFNNAIKYLKDFDANGAKQVQLTAYGAIGDAYSELKKNSDAIEYYKKAASTFEEDEEPSAEYLFRAALLSETEGKTKEALELYKQLRDKFPGTQRGTSFNVNKYINRLSVEPNEFTTK